MTLNSSLIRLETELLLLLLLTMIMAAGSLNPGGAVAEATSFRHSHSGPPGCPAADLVSPYLEEQNKSF